MDPIFIAPTMSPEVDECLIDSKLWVFLLTIFSVYVFAFLIILIHRLISNALTKKISSDSHKSNIKRSKSSKFYYKIECKCQELINGHSTGAQILTTFVLLLTVVSFINCYSDSLNYTVERCARFFDDISAQLDILWNIFFFIYFIIRLIAASDKVWFMVEIYTIVDFLIIPPSFVQIYLDRLWIGFRFTRIIMLMLIPKLIQCSDIRRSNLIKIFKFIFTSISVLLTIAGFIYLFENSGDVWLSFESNNKHEISYFECLYIIILIISTVGYGNIYVTTITGKIFILILILICFFIIVWYLIKILDLINISHQNTDSLISQHKHHVIVCGYLSFDNMNSFLSDFYHKKRKNDGIEVVLLSDKSPELELRDLLCKYRANYFIGSVMNGKDLQRIRADRSDACFVFADKQTDDHYGEDSNNIMRVLSIKNYSKHIRVIIQLLQSQNQYYLQQNKCWNPELGDEVIDLSQIRLGIVGQSCLAPGFSCLLSNLLSYKQFKYSNDKNIWENEYMNGSKMRIFSQLLSISFDGMTFKQTAELCFTKLKILLLAVEEVRDNDKKNSNILINPRDYEIKRKTKGYFVAKDEDSVKRAFWYCNNCHNDVTDEKIIKKCQCFKEEKVKKKYIQPLEIDSIDQCDSLNLLPITSSQAKQIEVKENKSKIEKKSKKHEKKNRKRHNSTSSSSSDSSDNSVESKNNETIGENNNNNEIKGLFDSTAMFHFCAEKSIDDCILDKNSSDLKALNNHIIIGLLTEQNCPSIGIKNLLLPLRSSNIEYKDLKHVLIVGNIDFLRNEWRGLRNIPKINVYNGSLLCREDVKAINIMVCDMCVILSSCVTKDKAFADKDSILATINVKTITFDDSTLGLIGDKISKSKTESQSVIIKPRLEVQRKGSVYGVNVPLIREILYENNVKTESYASGTVFTTSLIDSLMSSIYFNSDILSFVKTLISGGLNSKMQSKLMETNCLTTSALNNEKIRNRDRSRIEQISLKGPFSKYSEAKYGQLFCDALNSYGILCLGIYRSFNLNETNSQNNMRYVITSPSQECVLNPNDLIFASLQMNTDI